ncbi:glycerophosphodiester phosphodiesterase family protein [Deinococcus oregonensis]|uniref:Glycerophosphodiester phosphodiesterase family protein n=1 Tax=Deinococcus oregonensis TaxID=1805970 RepID=A0ABV6B4R6_9DEIO
MIIGHRGSSHLWPENSLEGFHHLRTLGVEGAEFDVHLTADDQVVVIHDPALNRTTHGSGAVRDRTLCELQDTRLRESAEGLPSLEEVLELFQGSAQELHIELKTDTAGRPYPGLEARVLSAIHRHGVQQRSILTSFDLDVLATVRDLNRASRILTSVDQRTLDQAGGFEQAISRAAAIPDIYIAVEHSVLKRRMSQASSAVSADRLGVWVVNEVAELSFWLEQPIRQITTDRVDLALKLRLAQSSSSPC